MIFGNKLYVGNSEVARAYLGSTLVFSASTSGSTSGDTSGSTSGSEVTITLRGPWSQRAERDMGFAYNLSADGMRYTLYDTGSGQYTRLFVYEDNGSVSAEVHTYGMTEIISSEYDYANDNWVIVGVFDTSKTYYIQCDVRVPQELVDACYSGSTVTFDGSTDEYLDPEVGYKKRLVINNIPTPTFIGSDEAGTVSVDVNGMDDFNANLELSYTDPYDQSSYYETITCSDSSATVTYSNGELVIMGIEIGDHFDINYGYSSPNCYEVVSGDTEEVELNGGYLGMAEFPTPVINQECNCGNTGGEWDYDENVCRYDSTLTVEFGMAAPIEIRVLDSEANTIASLNIQDPDDPQEYYDPDFYGGLAGSWDGGTTWELGGKFYGMYDVVYDTDSDTDITPTDGVATFNGGQVESVTITLETPEEFYFET